MDPAVFDGAKLRIEAGHVRGAMKVAAGSYDNGKGMGFNVTLDVSVAVPASLTPLPNAAASAEAKALQACRVSAAKRDDTARAQCFAPDNPAMRSSKTDASLFWTMLRAYDPVFEMTTLTITAGRTRGDWVELSIQGVMDGAKAKGSSTCAAWRAASGIAQRDRVDLQLAASLAPWRLVTTDAAARLCSTERPNASLRSGFNCTSRISPGPTTPLRQSSRSGDGVQRAFLPPSGLPTHNTWC